MIDSNCEETENMIESKLETESVENGCIINAKRNRFSNEPLAYHARGRFSQK